MTSKIEKKSLEIITGAIQRYSRSHVADITTTSFQLPNEEIKGKIIGREGRNIRTLEKATGVELVIDEAPESIIISSFDPVRREIARMALEKLIKEQNLGKVWPGNPIKYAIKGVASLTATKGKYTDKINGKERYNLFIIR